MARTNQEGVIKFVRRPTLTSFFRMLTRRGVLVGSLQFVPDVLNTSVS